MYCKECGSKHPGFNNYCPNDGQVLIATFPSPVHHKSEGFCAGCGNSVTSSAQYCKHCGESNSISKTGVAKKIQQPQTPINTTIKQNTKIQLFTSKSLTSIFLALGISILLMFVAAFLLKTEAETAMIELSEGEITRGQFHSFENYIASEFENEYEVNLDLPSIYNIFTYISFMHGVDFELTGEAFEKESDFFQYGIDINVQNFSAPLLLITFLILFMSGVVLGFYTKKDNVPMWQSIMGFSFLYGIFVAISSFIAGFKYDNDFDSAFAEVSLNFVGKFPLVESFFSGLFLAATIAGSSALFMVYKKQTFIYLQTKASYIQYLAFSIFLILGGLFSMAAITLAALSASPAAEELFEYFELNGIALFGSFSIWIWDLAHFLPINLSMREFGETESYTFHLLESLSDNQNDIISSFFVAETFPIWVKLSFLLPAALLVVTGYYLYTTHRMKIIELLKFSAFYGLFMVIVKLFTSLKLFISSTSFGESDEALSIQVHSDLISVFLISTLYALAFFSAGGFLKRYLSES
ncbi:zinc ribbon domain-containing protein [Planococcus sp. APC 3900]|uniref:zinc ribbon domain-containing protein n=1 Tax=Planococcus sp. APC 3900 TaxID=3035191 RepID=UPI0025B4F60E|nr:zinc ribbon domain-containing protein [Planococcus sp. APC 3900]MDN3437326.1 zinc ribbon domain-containing protein [Planococcus sp. APC 3900]